MRLALAGVLALLSAVAVEGLGSSATVAIAGNSGTVCGVLAAAGDAPRSVRCARAGSGSVVAFAALPDSLSFEEVSGGDNFVCGVRSGGQSFFCWDAANSFAFPAKRVYNGITPVRGLSVGNDQVCAIRGDGTGIQWWRGGGLYPNPVSGGFRSLTSGRGFSCAISANDSRVRCWGPSSDSIQRAFASVTMATIVAGDSHVCGLDTGGVLLCKGSNSSGQLNAPTAPAFKFSNVAPGINHTCAISTINGTVLCWGGAGSDGYYTPVNSTSFEFIVSGGNLTCGLTTASFSVVCWVAGASNPAVFNLPLTNILPGSCTSNQSSCACGPYPDSKTLCSNFGVICKPCFQPPSPAAAPPPTLPAAPPPSSSGMSKKTLAFLIIGAVGCFVGVCSIAYCIWARVCRRKKVHNSVQPTIVPAAGNRASNAGVHVSGNGKSTSPFTSPTRSRSRIFRRQGSRVMGRQRSGPSSFKDRPEEFIFAELEAATKSFSLETKIGAGSFGTVYKGKLADGREVAIKRSETGSKTKKFQEKESAYQSELAFLPRLHHKHLVGFVGYCEEKEERLLVYEFMKNGALYDHLHAKKGDAAGSGGSGESGTGVMNSWKMRLKVLLDASRGIEYLHNYAVPPIIHRDIKSSNILLDGNWTARVSDFGLSLMGPETENGYLSMRAAGTVGYMDPEYYGLHHLTVKSDVYGFGVVMLEVLTGKHAIFKGEECGNPVSVVDYAVPSIASGEVAKVLDERVGQPRAGEAEAVELVAYIAVRCVSLEGKDRPTMTDIVANLESAMALCDGSHGSISSQSISLSFD